MCTHAQDTAQKMRLTFAIDHEHKNALEFTSTDARKLYQFFTDKSEVQTCEAAKMKVISRVYEKSGGNTTYREQNMIKTLNNMGFAVSKLECYAENIVFKLYKSSQKKMMKGVSAIDEFEYMNDAQDEESLVGVDGNLVLTLAAPEIYENNSTDISALSPTIMESMLATEQITPIDQNHKSVDNSLIDAENIIASSIELDIDNNIDFLSLAMFVY